MFSLFSWFSACSTDLAGPAINVADFNEFQLTECQMSKEKLLFDLETVKWEKKSWLYTSETKPFSLQRLNRQIFTENILLRSTIQFFSCYYDQPMLYYSIKPCVQQLVFVSLDFFFWQTYIIWFELNKLEPIQGVIFQPLATKQRQEVRDNGSLWFTLERREKERIAGFNDRWHDELCRQNSQRHIVRHRQLPTFTDAAAFYVLFDRF